MKVLLIYPYCIEERLHGEDISVVPIGLYYVGALLKENHYDVEILNWHNINKTPEKIEKSFLEKKPDVIGFSILHANRWGGIEIARIAKQIDPEVKIVFGGIGATFLWKHFLTHFKDIDFIVTGEGEYPFLNLLQYIEDKNVARIDKIRIDKIRIEKIRIEKIKGIAYRKGNTYKKTGPAEVVQDLDGLPVPATYFKYHHVSSTRGCPGNCTFCGSPKLWGHKVRFHSPEYFVNHLELLYKKGVTFFYFSDDTFTIQKERVIEICKKILEKNLKITWVAISNVKYVNEEILPWMRKAGCIQISYGVESGSEKIRTLLRKNINRDQIKKAFFLTTRYGILARAYFIYGSPGETLDTIGETIDLIREIKPLSIIFYILDIFPGTALYEELIKRQDNPDITDNPDNMDDIWLKQIEDIMYFESDPGLSGDFILSSGKKLRTSFYENLPGFVKAIELIDKKEFYELHADFLSRVGMTFNHGDYAGIEAIKDKDNTAKWLYTKSLHYHPDHRAFLGLGILKQKNRELKDSIKILSKGLEYYPDSQPLNICMGINYMNSGEFTKALSYFLKFKDSKEAVFYIADCYKAIGDNEKASFFESLKIK